MCEQMYIYIYTLADSLHLKSTCLNLYEITRIYVKYWVSNALYQVIATKHLVPRTWYQGLRTKYFYPVLGTKYLVPGTWYQVPGTEFLVPSTFTKYLGTTGEYGGNITTLYRALLITLLDKYVFYV